MKRLDVRGASLAVLEKGQGDPLVLVHGTVSDYRSWSALVDPFARDFRTIAYSRRYHWPNDEIPEGADYSMLEQADDLGALIDAADAGPAHVVGHSYGGYLALLVAMRSPKAVRRLVLVEPPVLPLFASVPPRPFELARLLFTRPSAAMALVRFGMGGIRPAIEAFERGDPDEGFRRFATAVLGRETLDNMPGERLAQARDNLIEAEFLGSGFAPVSGDEIAQIPHATLLVGSTESPAIFECVLDRLEELIEDTERVRFSGVSHNLHEEDPESFRREVARFLGRTPAGPDVRTKE